MHLGNLIYVKLQLTLQLHMATRMSLATQSRPRTECYTNGDFQIGVRLSGKEIEPVHKRLPLNIWIQKMDKVMLNCLAKLELFSETEWMMAIEKIQKMKVAGVPYRSKTDENFTNAVNEVEMLLSIRHDNNLFVESMMSMVSYYASCKRRKAMEEIGFVLNVVLIQPQLVIMETW